ncbi:response regulator transcription factor [Pedosphaera parvula]|uniref:Response regulator receiver protein n=1 Tax=Pedosphaera parvula (strain Ellin514) TaxID=320771 RepID=B9XDM0_PEDPL|nr:response regulator [Pedosphaera parvula]EEF62166.1 response regulator receiver protein [Pedosphaera parvula Ellin514]
MAKILIVDDLPTEVQLMRSAIASLGHSVVVATDGEQAVEMAHRESPDLMLLDVVLPRMDGFQVCRKIKKDPNTSNIQVILISSKTQESDKFWGLKQGANAYIFKPFSPQELVDAVKKNLR